MSPERLPRHIPGIPETSRGLVEPQLAGSRLAGIAFKQNEAPGRASLEASSLAIGWEQGRKKHILAQNISFKVYAGHLVALVGPNGAGKSSLLRTIAGLQAPCGGLLSLLGKNIAQIPVEERASLLACVFNERMESGYLTVSEFVAFGRYPYTNARNRLTSEDKHKIAAALALVGMNSFAQRTFVSLSDGEKQKVQIARAVAQDTPVLVLDEPTAFLDAPSRIEIFRLAERLAQEAGKAVVLCTHEVDLALKTADELWVLDREHRFTAGAPFVVARSGAIGRAFDLPTVAFDSLTGTFRPRSAR
jgi:iron complex transport system ATP-binding protein